MQLGALVDGFGPLAVTGSADVDVDGVAIDSRQVRPGDVFFVESAGGGGWGPPSKRRREARAADAANGFVRRRARG